MGLYECVTLGPNVILFLCVYSSIGFLVLSFFRVFSGKFYFGFVLSFMLHYVSVCLCSCSISNFPGDQ